MNAYQQKWLQILHNATLAGWQIEPLGEDILITMPHVTDLKVVRDNLPAIIAELALDIDLPHERLRLIVKNGYEEFDYVINP